MKESKILCFIIVGTMFVIIFLAFQLEMGFYSPEKGSYHPGIELESLSRLDREQVELTVSSNLYPD